MKLGQLALGAELKQIHQAVGLTWFRLAHEVVMSEGHLHNLAYGLSFTRRSTLARIVDVAVAANPDLGPADVLLERLCEAAGAALRPESEFPERTARTLRRRQRHRDLGTWIP
jgi:hypothetical protein